MKELTTKEAVELVLVNGTVRSKYALAKLLDVQGIMINNYLTNGTRMGDRTAMLFEDALKIKISDAYDGRSTL